MVITAWLYWPTTSYSLLIFDDDRYVTDNLQVKQGLSFETVRWAFTTLDEEFWHPLTWLTYLLDYSIYGLFAGGYHFTNLLFHAANTGLIFYALWRMTRKLWPAALVAALFGWHPLHVESVAWIAERKDLVSGFFFSLTLIAYVRYTEQRNALRYFTTLGLFALGLMAKPMLVTLPCVLLLLDYWPLRQAELNRASLANWLWLLWEKLPLLGLSVASGLLTIVAQGAGGSLKSVDQVPMALRALNALAAYARYLAKTFWPVDLCVHYPLPVDLPVAAAMSSLALLAVVSGVVLWQRKPAPWALVGWLWFLGMLVPVIGLLQVGLHALADRYSYLPAIGVFILVAWAGERLSRSGGAGRVIALSGAIAGVLACLVVSRQQLGVWRDSVTLFTQVVAIYSDLPLAQGNLGVALSKAGRSVEAIEHFQRALKLHPNNCGYNYNLGGELAVLERWSEAKHYFNIALDCPNPINDPAVEQIHNNLGVVLAQQGQLDAALQHFQQAIRLQPNYPKSYFNLAMALEKLGQRDAAVTNYSLALAKALAQNQKELIAETEAKLQSYQQGRNVPPGTPKP